MNEPSTLVTILSVIVSCFFAAACYLSAKKRARNEKLWAALGLFFGLFAFITIYLLPKKQQSNTKPIKETSGASSSLHNESAASLDDNENFETPINKRLSGSNNLSWYYIDPKEDNAIKGPYPLNDLRKEIHNNKLDGSTHIWCEEFEEWTMISEFSNAGLMLDSDFIQ